MGANFIFPIIFILLSAFFSASEMAFITARKIKFLVWIKQGRRGAENAYEFLQKPEKFLSTTLVGNNIAVVSFSIMLTFILQQKYNGFVITLFTTMVLLIFGEVIPKFIGGEIANTFTLHSYRIHLFFHILFFPIIWVLEKFSLLILTIFKFNKENSSPFFTRRDLNRIVLEGEKSGIIDRDERNRISKMVIRGRKKVQDVMIPRTEIIAIDITTSVRDAALRFRQTGFSRLPVMDESLDRITGLVYAPDLICRKPERLDKIVRDILFVPETVNMLNLLHMMRIEGKTMAIAIDEFGGTAGLITIEDMLEEFFGEIKDEYDDNENLISRIGLTRLDVNARIEVDDLNEQFNLGIPEGDYQTLGGLVTNKLGRIPRRGERIEVGDLVLIVLAAQDEKVNRIRILKLNNEEIRESHE